MAARRTLLASALSATLVFAVNASCGGGTGPGDETRVASAATSTVSVSAPSVLSGNTVIVTLQAKDAAGANLTTGGANVAFGISGSGTSAGTFSAVTDNANGTYNAVFTGTTAGTARSISATLNGSTVSTTMPTVTVTPGVPSLAQSTVEVSSSSIQVGATATLTLRTRDAAGNANTTGGFIVTFTKGSGTSDGTIGSVTDNANGTYTATFTATTAGSARSIGASLGTAAVTSTAPTITVTPAPAGPPSAATSTVNVSASTVASGSSVTITLQAKDASGVNISVGGATVAFSLGAGTSTGTIGTVIDNNNGTYTASFTGVLVGTARSIAATLNTDAVTTAQPTIIVTPGAASAAMSVVGVSNASIISGTTASLTLNAKDAAGNDLTSGGATVAFALGSGTSAGTISGVTDNANGTYSATFTGTIAGTARVITATVNSATVTTTAPTITVSPGSISTATSVVTIPVSYVAVTSTTSLVLTARDAAGNPLTTGGSTISFNGSGGSGSLSFGGVNDHGNGTYTGSATGVAEGTEISIGATIDGSAVTTPKPGLTVYTRGLTFSTDSVPAVATSGQMGTQQILAVFANGAQRADGLQANIAYTTPSIAACQSSNWLGTPTFDLPDANPLSLLSFTPNATTLGVYACTATVTISSTTAGYANKEFKVVLNVARGLVASTAVNLIAMGDAGNNTVQNILPDARVTITNGGRGIVSNVQATVIAANSNGSPESWLTNGNLRWEPVVGDPSQRTLPATLIVTTSVAPFSADATIRVTGNGMPNLDIPVNIFFNVEPEVVANPRGLTFTAFAGGPSQQATVVAYNSNRTAEGFDGVVDSLRAYERTPAPALPPWITSVTFAPLTHSGMDTASTVTVTINPASLVPDSAHTDTVRIRAQRCTTDTGTNTCTQDGFRPDYELPVTVVVERGLVVSAADVTMFAAAGTNTVIRDVQIANGGATPISGLSVDLGGAAWLSHSFIGGTAAPTTLQLTANPTGFARGTVLSTTVTVSASTPTGVPSKSFPVTFRVY